MSKFFRLLMLGLLPFAFTGCGGDGDALQQRAQEFQYTVDSLGSEMVKRLQAATTAKARSMSESARGADIRELEADRGGDGGRPDPSSVDAIITDAAVKVTKVAGTTATEAANQLISLVDQAEGISATIKKEFSSGLLAAVEKLPAE